MHCRCPYRVGFAHSTLVSDILLVSLQCTKVPKVSETRKTAPARRALAIIIKYVREDFGLHNVAGTRRLRRLPRAWLVLSYVTKVTNHFRYLLIVA